MAKWIAKFSAEAKRYEIEAESFDDALRKAYEQWAFDILKAQHPLPSLNTLCRAEDELTGIKLVVDRIDAAVSRLVFRAYKVKRRIK